MKALRVLIGTIVFFFLIGPSGPGGYGSGGDPKAGKKTYGVLCASCHGQSGKGDGPTALTLPVKPQNHTDGKYMNTLTDKYLFDFIKGGGTSVGKSPLMPPWGGQLKDQDIFNLLAYIRSLAVPPYKPAK